VFADEAPGEAAGEDADEPTTADWGARERGVFLHKALELFDPVDGNGLEAACDAALAALGPELAPPDDVRASLPALLARLDGDPAIAALRDTLGTPGVRFFREVPFLLPRDPGFLSGTLDLLIEHEDGALTVVDYKSGAASPAAIERYRTQAALYAWATGRITGRTVRGVRLVMLGADPVAVRSFPAEAAFLARAEELLR